MLDFADLAKEYGLGVAILMLFAPWIYRVDSRSRKNRHSLENVHLQCHIPRGAVAELRQEVEELERVDHDLETRFAVVESELREIKTDVKQVLMHLTLKGIDK